MRDLSTLSKLLAEEDIHVVYRNQSTAAFDVKNRELSLPIWKDMSDVVQELMTCHEVGHALWTPLEMLEKVKEEKINFSFVNVLEDVRIEKLVQTKYPGSVRIFNKGYKELINGNFFETVGKDISKYNLIDRINLHYKHHSDVPFSDEEKVWVQKANQTKTPQDVLDLAKELYKFIEENESSQGENKEQSSNDMSNDTSTQTVEVSSDNQGEEKNTDGQDTQQDTQSEKSADGENKKEQNDDDVTDGTDDTDSSETVDAKIKEVTAENQSEGSSTTKNTDTEIVAVTDEVSRRSMEKYKDDDTNNYEYGFIPKVNLNKTIISTKDILDVYSKKFSIDRNYDPKYWNKTLEEVNNLKKDSKKTVAYMVKEFEMKKAADLYARASTSKTGSLDMSKLHTYKFSDDIFSKITRLPGATNHGLVMFLDWSGSMSTNLKGTLNQLFQLIWFCNRTKIPFEVYAFTNQWLDRRSDIQYETTDKKPGTLMAQVHLLNIFSSNNKITEQDTMMHYLWMHGSRWSYRDWREDGYPYSAPKELELGSTPLNDTVIVAMDLVPKLQSKMNVQKIHSIFLTDGASDPLRGVHHIYTNKEDGSTRNGIMPLSSWKSTMIFKDLKTNTTVKSKDHEGSRPATTMLLELLRKRVPNMSIVNFFICGSGRNGNIKSETLYHVQDDFRYLGYSEMKQLVKKINSDRYYMIKNGQGFDNLYLLPGLGNFDVNENLDLEDGVVYNKGQLKRAFSKFASSKVTNRPLLNNFIKMVA